MYRSMYMQACVCECVARPKLSIRPRGVLVIRVREVRAAARIKCVLCLVCSHSYTHTHIHTHSVRLWAQQRLFNAFLCICIACVALAMYEACIPLYSTVCVLIVVVAVAGA